MIGCWMLDDESKPWTIFVSHPHDFTPVCTTERGACHMQSERFAKIGMKLIGSSCDSVEDHHGGSKDVLAREGQRSEGQFRRVHSREIIGRQWEDNGMAI